jgi:hypothetical protein
MSGEKTHFQTSKYSLLLFTLNFGLVTKIVSERDLLLFNTYPVISIFLTEKFVQGKQTNSLEVSIPTKYST